MNIQEIFESCEVTGASLVGKFKAINKQGDYNVITYVSDDLTVDQKKEIEKNFLKLLSEKKITEKYLLMGKSFSEKLKKVPKKTEAPSANLKVGHAGPAKKRELKNVKNIIAVASGKGGVGKSTFSTNLAISLLKEGKKVGLIDSDIYGPSIPLLLGAEGEKPTSNKNKKIVPLEKYDLKFMSFGLFIEKEDPVIWRGPMLGGVLNQFLFDVEWGELDYLIIDLPPGTGDIQLSLVQNIDITGAVIISTPQDLALLDATKGLNMFKKMDIPILGMVENMSTFICGDCGSEHDIFGKSGVERSCQELGLKLLGKIGLDMDLRIASDSGVPYMTSKKFEESPIYKSYTQIAQNLDNGLNGNDNTKKGFFSRILRR